MSGFRFARSLAQGDVSGKIETFSVDAGHASILAIGDVVDATGTANADGIMGVDAAGTTGQIVGVIVGFDFDPDNLTDTGLPAGTAGLARVCVDPLALFEVDVANGPLVAANVGLNANIVNTAATRSGGMTSSNMTLNATGVAATATFPFTIVALREDDAGVLGNRALVRMNESLFSKGVTGA